MAPEQMREAPVDERVDIYTTGLVLYEMLTGVRAFDGVDLGAILMKQHQVDPAPFSQAAPGVGISPEIEAIVRRALAKSPDARFASAAQMSSALEEAGSPSRLQHAATVRAAIGTGSGLAQRIRALGHRSERERFRLLVGRRFGVVAAAARRHRERLGALLGPRLRLIAAAAREQGQRRRASLQALLEKHPRIAVGTLAALLVVSVIAATSGTTAVERPRPVPMERAVPATRVTGSARPRVPPPAPQTTPKLAAVEAFLSRGERERAIALLRELRSAEPADPEYSAMQARLAFEQRRWAEALSAYRATIRLDDARRGDPVFINGSIDSLQNEATSRAAEELLRMVGDPAKPYVSSAATEHPIPRVRGRARALLRNWDRTATAWR